VASERVTDSRVAALEVLRAVRAGDLGDRALDRRGASLPVRDRAWTQELVYGTLRLRGRIDHLLGELVKGGLGSLEPDVLDILRLGCYQLLEMGGVPAYAAVSQSVELAREAGAGRASGLVNGVLQSVRRRGAEIPFPDGDADPVGHLVAWGSHPRWLVERWLEQFGLDETRRLVDRDNEKPELYLTIVEGSAAAAVEALAAGGIEAEPVEASPDSVRLGRGASARDALRLVPAVVQDPAAALVVRFADPGPDARILDLCAAPGGKAVGLARNARTVVAADLSPGRLTRLRDNVARLGLADRVLLVAADARRPPFAPADAVLLDAPCTGTGTLRRHPDGRWRISPADLAELEELQAELFVAAADLVRPGGLLVYSTCSLEPEENELQVRRFLADNPGFELDPPSGVVDSRLVTPEGFLNVLPQREGFDGSFAARIRRIAR
jgi:16S rRNA (cytosine967-C5)-methyltransferase